jgi:hypothetical protein
MSSLLEWLVRDRCVWHAEPMFDRDGSGHAVFRCPRCMATWPILPGQQTRRGVPAPLPFEAGQIRARRRLTPRPATPQAVASGR